MVNIKMLKFQIIKKIEDAIDTYFENLSKTDLNYNVRIQEKNGRIVSYLGSLNHLPNNGLIGLESGGFITRISNFNSASEK